MINKKFNKLVLNTVSKAESRPVLKDIHYENGNLYATNAHVAIKMLSSAPKDLKLTLNPITFEVTDAAYPSMDPLFPKKEDAEVAVKLSLDNLKSIVPLLKANKGTKKQLNIVEVVLKDNKLTFTVNNSSTSVNVSSDKEFTIKFDDKLLLTFVDGYIAGANKTSNNDITFNYYQEIRPVLITSKFLDYLITPMRTF